jgi:uncharacterized membrane protein
MDRQKNVHVHRILVKETVEVRIATLHAKLEEKLEADGEQEDGELEIRKIIRRNQISSDDLKRLLTGFH